MDNANLNTWCPQCGPHVRVNEDGCCATCGADAVGPGVDVALKLEAERDRLREALRQIRRGKLHEDGGRYEIMAARLIGIAARALEE